MTNRSHLKMRKRTPLTYAYLREHGWEIITGGNSGHFAAVSSQGVRVRLASSPSSPGTDHAQVRRLTKIDNGTERR